MAPELYPCMLAVMVELLIHHYDAVCRDPVGDCVVAGDLRWAGTFGVNVDFVARSHCSVALIAIEDIQVMSCTGFQIEAGNLVNLIFNTESFKIQFLKTLLCYFLH